MSLNIVKCILAILSLFLVFEVAVCRSVNDTSEIKHVKLIIVGAGASGFAAGCRLLENGFDDFIILEAQNRTGGRVYSVPFGKSTIDMGGEWVHGKEGNVVHPLASDLNLIYTAPDHTNKIYRSDGKAYNNNLSDALMELFTNIYDDTATLTNNTGSVGQFFIERYWPRVNPLIEAGNVTRAEAQDFLKLFEHMVNSNDASPDWLETAITEITVFSPINWSEYSNVWKEGGYSTVFDILSKKIPNPNKRLHIEEKIRLGKEVTRVDWSGPRVQVSTADGLQLTSDRVLITVSLNVLKATANQIFQPTLPASNVKAIKNLGMGTVDKIYLEFPYRWWELGTDGLLTVWRAEDLAQVPQELKWITGVFAFSAVGGLPHNLLCCWINGRAAEAMEAVPENVVKEELMKVLRRFAGPSREVPDAVSIRRTTWFSNPYTRGSYSCRMLSSDVEDVWAKDLAKPVSNATGSEVLLFAGEATSDAWFSTVNGAIETGWREADRIISKGFHN